MFCHAAQVVDAVQGVCNPVGAFDEPDRYPAFALLVWLECIAHRTVITGQKYPVVVGEPAGRVACCPGALCCNQGVAVVDQCFEARKVALTHRPHLGPGPQQVGDEIAHGDLVVGQVFDDTQAGCAAGHVDQAALVAPIVQVVVPGQAVAWAERQPASTQAAAVGQFGRGQTPGFAVDGRKARLQCGLHPSVTQGAGQTLQAAVLGLDPNADAAQIGLGPAGCPEQIADQILAQLVSARERAYVRTQLHLQHALLDPGPLQGGGLGSDGLQGCAQIGPQILGKHCARPGEHHHEHDETFLRCRYLPHVATLARENRAGVAIRPQARHCDPTCRPAQGNKSK